MSTQWENCIREFDQADTENYELNTLNALGMGSWEVTAIIILSSGKRRVYLKRKKYNDYENTHTIGYGYR
jgi:hypothetical protein